MDPSLIEATSLRRVFRTFQRRPGVLGAVRDLFRLGGEDRIALDGLDLKIGAGERVALIGPNGAGKSTTIKLMCGILKPTSGHLRVVGREPWRQRRQHVQHIGVVFGQRSQLWWDLAVIEAFDLLASIFKVSPSTYQARLKEFDTVLDLGPLLRLPVRELSLGQRMRCDIAAALLHGPPLLLLDEPTIGLDVDVKLRIRDFICALNQQQGTTIILTTHDLTDVEAVCERVVLLDQGQVLFDGSTADLKKRLGGRHRLIFELDRALPTADRHELETRLPLEASWLAEGRRAVLSFTPTQTTTAEIVRLVLDHATAQGCQVLDLSVKEPEIDELIARYYRGETGVNINDEPQP